MGTKEPTAHLSFSERNACALQIDAPSWMAAPPSPLQTKSFGKKGDIQPILIRGSGTNEQVDYNVLMRLS